nr:MAG TPA: hypothetical protein [Caudoviricetes sp.]
MGGSGEDDPLRGAERPSEGLLGVPLGVGTGVGV